MKIIKYLMIMFILPCLKILSLSSVNKEILPNIKFNSSYIKMGAVVNDASSISNLNIIIIAMVIIILLLIGTAMFAKK